MSYKKWLYQNQEFKTLEDFPPDTFGFVYKITNICDGRFYVGRKVLYNNVSKILTKKEIAEWDKPGRVPKKRKITKESDWQDYWGSNKQIKQDLKDAKTNDLKSAAKIRHGYYDESKAVQWAKNRGKYHEKSSSRGVFDI